MSIPSATGGPVAPGRGANGKAEGLPRIAYRPREIAKLTGISSGKVYRAIRENELRATRRGRVLIVLAEDLKRWLSPDAAG